MGTSHSNQLEKYISGPFAMTSFGLLLSFAIMISFVSGGPSEQCRPSREPYFISDNEQCDKFHMCDENGNLSAELLCEDGMVFETVSKECILPFHINCAREGRSKLREPKPRNRCPRLNGRWAIEDTCDMYIDCTSGIERQVKCENHLVFDEERGDCQHPDEANRAGCTAEEIYGFTCPTGDRSLMLTRHPAEGGCRVFFDCGVHTMFNPRLSGCGVGTVFNEVTQQCDQPENVPRCKDYYN